MSQQHTLPVTLPPALSQEPLKPVSPADTHQEEQVKQPTPLPVPGQNVPSGIPGEVPLVHEEKHTTPVKGVSKQDCKPQQQELCLEQQQPQQESQKQEVHLEQHLGQQQVQQESQKQEVHLEQHLEQQQVQQESQEQEVHLEQQQQEPQEQEVQQQQGDEHEDHQEAESLEKQLEEAKTQRELKGQLEEKKLLDQQLDGELAKGGEQLEKKEKQPLQPLELQEGKLDPPTSVPAPGQVQETHPVQTLKGEVLPPTEQQQQKQEMQWPPKHK